MMKKMMDMGSAKMNQSEKLMSGALRKHDLEYPGKR